MQIEAVFSAQHLIYFFSGLAALLFCFRVVIKDLKRTRAIKEFPNYAGVLEFHMEKAYEIIYSDQIMVYSLEAMHPKKDEIDNASKSFVRLVIKLMGKTMYDELSYVYGGQDTLVFNMLEYFNNKYANDEIRRTSVQNLSESEESE